MADISKVNVNSTDYDLKDQKSRDALVDVVDNGAKNLSQFNSGTAAADNVTLATGVPLVGLAGEVLVFSYETTLSSGIVTVGFKDANGNATGSVEIGNVSKQKIVTIPEGTAKFNVFVSKAGTYTNFMVCTKSEWDISHTYIPYGKTNADLTNENANQQLEIDYAVNAGVKNFLDVQRPTATTRTSYTPLANGGVELSCSNATWTSYAIADIPVEAGKEYTITFLLDESSGTSNFYFFLRNGNSSGTNLATKKYGSATGNYEVSFTPSNSVIWLGIYLNNSATAATATAKLRCMLRPAEITDPAFQPYSKTNRELTVAEAEDRAALAEVIDGGAAGTKNLFDMSGAQTFDVTGYGVHCTINKSTGVITLDGTNQDKKCTGSFNIKVADSTSLGLIAGTVYKLTCDGYTTSDTTIGIYVYTSGATPKAQFDTYNHTELAWNSSWEQSNGFRLFVRSGTVVNNITLRPMLCRKTLYDANPEFEPHAPAKTNVEITPALVEVVDAGAKNKYPPFKTQSSRGSTGVTYSYTNGIVHATGTKSGSLNYIEVVENRPIGELGFSVGDTLVLSNTSDSLLLTIVLGDGTTFDPAVIVGNETKELIVGAGKTHIYVQCQILASVTGTIDLSATPMICTKAAWGISHEYQPYRPSWQEMYDSNKIIDISSQITAESGYRVESSTHLYYQNKQVFGTIAIAINSGSYSSYLTSIAKLPVEYAPARQYLGSCAFSTDQWAITDIGYAFLQSANASSQAQRGQISVKSPTANLTHMILNVCYPVQIDGTF